MPPETPALSVQTIITLAVVAVAALWVARRYLPLPRLGKKGAGKGKGSCGSDNCGCG